MTLQQAKSIARHLGLTLRTVCSGDYRVNFRDGNETTAYYTNNLDGAVKTAVEMARERGSCTVTALGRLNATDNLDAGRSAPPAGVPPGTFSYGRQ